MQMRRASCTKYYTGDLLIERAVAGLCCVVLLAAAQQLGRGCFFPARGDDVYCSCGGSRPALELATDFQVCASTATARKEPLKCDYQRSSAANAHHSAHLCVASAALCPPKIGLVGRDSAVDSAEATACHPPDCLAFIRVTSAHDSNHHQGASHHGFLSRVVPYDTCLFQYTFIFQLDQKQKHIGTPIKQQTTTATKD